MSVTQETLDLIKGAHAAPDDALAKSITTATGLVAYDLQAPAKNLYPIITPLRNRLPRVGGGVGVATNWKVVAGITGSGFDASPWVPEGQRAGRMSYTVQNKAASYVTIGEEDQASFESVSAGRTFEDIKSTRTMRLLQKMMQKEERALLSGNATLQLGIPAVPTLAASGTGGTLPAATYSVIVVALTNEGVLNSSLAAGVATSKVITGADGNTFTLNGGSSNKSASATQAITLGQTLTATANVIQGALGYAWFVGTVGNESLQQITAYNVCAINSPLVVRQLATAITADCSANPGLAFDGLLTTALNPANGAYFKNVASQLTASGKGSVNEIDQALQTLWDTYRVSPTVIWVNSQQQKDMTTRCMTGTGSYPLLSMDTSANDGGGFQITANGRIAYYYNPFAVDGGVKIPVLIHPDLPAGTILMWAENLPTQYMSNNVPNVAEVHVRQDYYEIEWPLRTRQYEHGVYAEEVLAVYAPFCMGVLTNITPG